MQKSYHNPVMARECADPFVLKYNGEFWCYRTGKAADGRIFAIFRSRDLVNWAEAGSAMDPLSPPAEHYWAPEVFYTDGRFYLYYAAGLGLDFHLRVAVADQPQGPFIDSGKRLTHEPFAIDAHVFEDDDGQRYLFYAADFLDHTRVGTGTVIDRLLDLYTLAGRPRPVSRARFDWQVFDPCRAEKGGVKWHTVEGSFTLKHKGRYYQMFSGGNYQNLSYGVGYAVTETLDRTDEWEQPIDGVSRMPVLRTIPGKVKGPGHNSVVRGPDNRQLYCIYHVIKPQERFERVLAIDPLEWVGDRLAVIGPSAEPRPLPIRAVRVRELEGQAGTLPCDDQGSLVLNAPDAGRVQTGSPAFLAEISLRPGADGIAHLSLLGDGKELWRFSLDVGRKLAAAHLADASASDWRPLPAGFNPASLHLLRLDVDHQSCSLSLDHAAYRWRGRLGRPADTFVIAAGRGALELTCVELTRGCEDAFEPGFDLGASGWQVSPAGCAQLLDGTLCLSPAPSERATLSKDLAFAQGELVCNLALPAEGVGSLHLGGGGLLFLRPSELAWQCGAGEPLKLPRTVPPGEPFQLRLRLEAGQATLMDENGLLGTCLAAPGPLAFHLETATPGLQLERVRLTEISG